MNRDPIGYADGGNLYGAYYIPNHYDPYGNHKWFGIGKWSITTSDGVVIVGTKPKELYQIIIDLHDQGITIDELIIKGHGDASGMYANKIGGGDNTYLEVGWLEQGSDVIIDVLVSGHEVTDELNSIVHSDTEITLRGCNTALAACRLACALPGVECTGTMGFSYNIPWTKWIVGLPRSYENVGPPRNERTR